jgi:hypothetical protein
VAEPAHISDGKEASRSKTDVGYVTTGSVRTPLNPEFNEGKNVPRGIFDVTCAAPLQQTRWYIKLAAVPVSCPDQIPSHRLLLSSFLEQEKYLETHSSCRKQFKSATSRPRSARRRPRTFSHSGKIPTCLCFLLFKQWRPAYIAKLDTDKFTVERLLLTNTQSMRPTRLRPQSSLSSAKRTSQHKPNRFVIHKYKY